MAIKFLRNIDAEYKTDCRLSPALLSIIRWYPVQRDHGRFHKVTYSESQSSASLRDFRFTSARWLLRHGSTSSSGYPWAARWFVRLLILLNSIQFCSFSFTPQSDGINSLLLHHRRFFSTKPFLIRWNSPFQCFWRPGTWYSQLFWRK